MEEKIVTLNQIKKKDQHRAVTSTVCVSLITENSAANRPLKPNVQVRDLHEIKPQNSFASYVLPSVFSIVVPLSKIFFSSFSHKEILQIRYTVLVSLQNMLYRMGNTYSLTS